MRRYTICARHHTALHFTTTYCNTHIHNALQHTKHPCNMNKTPRSTTPHGNILQHTATYCNILQHTATYCNILQHTAIRAHTTHCNTLHTKTICTKHRMALHHNATHTATHVHTAHSTQQNATHTKEDEVSEECGNTPHDAHTATHNTANAPEEIKSWSMRRYTYMQDTAIHCNTLQYTATHSNTLRTKED